MTLHSNSHAHDPVVIRDNNKENLAGFLKTLKEINCSFLDGYHDPKNAYKSFIKKYSKTYNVCFPVKKLTRKQSRSNKPWLSNALINCIKKKNRVYRKYLRNPTMDRQSIYKCYKNKLNYSLRIAKRLYYEKKLNNVQSTLATWKVLNDILNRSKINSNRCSTFKAGYCEITDPVEIALKFCSYFASIGPNLARGKQSSVYSVVFLMVPYTVNILQPYTTQDEIAEIAKTFLPGKAGGYDQIPMTIIKESILFVFEPLTHIINLPIQHGIVPDEMKIARVKPIFKSDYQSLFTNYRPISVLPSFSKFFERAIYNRLMQDLMNFIIVCSNQYGFRKNHSTALTLIDLNDKISTAFDRGEFSVGIFLDLSKAFDTVNHVILFGKPKHDGIRCLALNWIRSYFSNRKRYLWGPSGFYPRTSIFLLYVNDINNASNLFNILFADESNVFMSHKDLNYMLNLEMDKLSICFKANKTLRSVHFGVVVVELIKCKCGGIVKNEI